MSYPESRNGIQFFPNGKRNFIGKKTVVDGIKWSVSLGVPAGNRKTDICRGCFSRRCEVTFTSKSGARHYRCLECSGLFAGARGLSSQFAALIVASGKP